MTDKTFTASNRGRVLKEDGRIRVAPSSPGTGFPLSHKAVTVLREYFQHERDQQLGRARWPGDLDVVIYPDPHDDGSRCVRVVHEADGEGQILRELGPKWGAYGWAERAARWYFTEGPGKPERPWEEAEPGEVWRLIINGKERNGLFDGEEFALPNVNGTELFYAQPASALITAGRKLLNADGSLANE